MIPYMAGKLAPIETSSTRGLVKCVTGRGYFRAVPFQNRDKLFTSPPRPPIVERVGGRTARSETTLFLRQDPHALTVLAEAASDDL